MVTAPNVFGAISNTASVSATSTDPSSSNDSTTLVTDVLQTPSVLVIGTWALGGLAVMFGAAVFFMRRRRATDIA